jgi:N-acetylmuramoyl-L-alanine amidase
MKNKAAFFAAAFFQVFCFAQNSAQVDFLHDAQKAGITVYWDPMTLSCMAEKNGHRISFRSGDEFVLQDYKKIVMEKAPSVQDGKLVSSRSFFNMAENFFKTENSEILLDPGHGGKDPGASATHNSNGKKIKVTEKDVNLSVSLKLRDYLKKAYPDKNILMTRSTDVFLTLAQRTEIANSVKLKENEAILYVSVHVNSSLNENVTGFEVWYLSPEYRRQVLNSKSINEEASIIPILNSMTEEEYTTESILMARFILNGISAQVGSQSNSRGIKEEEWFVCRNSKMPSVLIELGFLTNKKEGLLLTDDRYLQKLSLGIYNGLQEFVTNFERTRGFTGN